MIRVLVVDDSLTVRKIVADHLRAAELEVVGEAADGSEGVALTHRLRPDVVLMDVVMPGIDGLAATRQIMMEIPTPVVILSGHANQQEVFKTYDALAAGALEVCAKPTMGGPEAAAEWNNILMTVRAAAEVSVTPLSPRTASDPAAPTVREGSTSIETCGPRRSIVVIGASTGGPVAVKEVLAQLPSDYPLPVVVAIHCNSRLSSSVAAWFDRSCSLAVRDARDGEPLPQTGGVVVTAPPGRNLRIDRGRTLLEDASGNTGCTPCVDVLFASTAECFGEETIGVLLTGMGADGAEGLKKIRNRGGCTIAQDEASCVVFGMPAAAIKLGAVEHVAPLQEIPRLLVRLAEAPSAVGASLERCSR